MTGLGGSAWVVIAIGGVWLAVAAALLAIAARRMRESRSVVAAARSLSALLDAAHPLT